MMKWRPHGTLELARRDHLSLLLDSISVSVIRHPSLRPTELAQILTARLPSECCAWLPRARLR